MAGAVDGGEGETTFVGLKVSSDLSGKQVGLPIGGSLPVEGGDPVLGSNGWDSTISVTRVVEHSDLALKLLIDPLGALWLDDVVDLVRAEVPGLNIIGDMECLSDNVQVQVVKKT